MLNAVEPIYNTLFTHIKRVAGSDLSTFERGFWFKEDCTQNIDAFPYAFLDQPETTPVEGIASPSLYRYEIHILLVVLTYKSDQSGLFFNQTLEPQARGAVELVHSIAQQVWDQDIFGMPLAPEPIDWDVEKWTLGPMRRPRLTELDDYFKNKYIAGASVDFIFTIQENGPDPANLGG